MGRITKNNLKFFILCLSLFIISLNIPSISTFIILVFPLIIRSLGFFSIPKYILKIQDWHSRLLKLGEVTFTGGVWEHFSAGAKVGRINVPYDHYANSKGFGDWLERHDRYSSWDAQKVVDFLETGKTSALGTERKLKLRLLAAKLWLLRPIVRFIQMYFLRFGFLEGTTSLIFCLLYAMYEFMTVVKIIELKRKKSGLPL